MKKILFQIGFLLVISLSTYAQELGISNINATGKLKVNGNAGTPGQVLTSNGAAASPTWNTSTSPPVFGGKFLIRQGTVDNGTSQPNNLFTIGANAPNFQTAFIDFSSQDYNTNSDVSINLGSDVITINRTGLYHFEGLIKYKAIYNAGDQFFPTGSLAVKIGNNPVLLTDTFFLNPNSLRSSFGYGLSFKMDRYLIAGQTIKFQVEIVVLNTEQLTSIGITGGGSFISGYFLSE
jgi:hypothetical protein